MANLLKREFQAFQELLFEMAQQLSLDALLKLIVERLSDYEEIALARIWLIQPGDICPSCPMATECKDIDRCLHLMASSGRSLTPDGGDWSRTDGGYRRIPFGLRKVGRIAVNGQTVEVMNVNKDSETFADIEWAQREQISSFGGQPLIFRGEILGVLAIFSRRHLKEGVLPMLRMVADHAAIAIANARAFEKINQLKRQFEVENIYLKEEFYTAQSYGDLIGKSPAHQKIIQQIELVAPTNASVLILGETGTGKELIARELHRRSLRHDKPLIKVNCAATPKELWNSEFLGHVKGAFTGAVKDRMGRLMAADKGAMFLDEVGETSLEHQSKLLRIIQEGEFERVGEEKTQKVDIRFISATNRSLDREVELGQFRKDLYYRLNVFPIEVPPLRQRVEDIPLLAEYFINLIARKMNRPKPALTRRQITRLQSYEWPGNIRELQNVVERAMIRSRSGTIELDLQNIPGNTTLSFPAFRAREGVPVEVLPEAEMIKRQRENIIAALRQTNWKVHGPGGAAELLGIKPTTLASRIKKMGLERPQHRLSEGGSGAGEIEH
jgi:transcriptional regulator with GAF, ATPase, and Fis domain